MLPIDVVDNVFHMMTINGFWQIHVLTCISIDIVKSPVEFIHKNDIIMAF